MDVSDLTKVASRKRMSEDAEKLRDKISRETAKIIKLKVAQDTAYWDLREKLQQVESNHERLQQNMVEVQMQHETISGQYQDELRLRPEILNKLGTSRELCEVLEEYGGRVRAGVCRAAADRAALTLASRAAAARVLNLAQHSRQHAALHHRLRESVERHAAAAGEACARLQDERVSRERAQADADRRAADLDRKDRLIAEMQRETKRLIAEFEARCTALEETVAEQQREGERREAAAVEARREAEAAAEARREAEAAAEARREAEAAAEAEAARKERACAELQHKLSEAEECIDRLNQSVTTLSEANERLTGELREKSQAQAQAAAQVQAQVQAQAQAQAAALERRVSEAQQERERAAEAHRALSEQLHQHRLESSCKVAELESRAADKEAQLQAASSTIARLMRDVQAEADARHRLDAAARAKDDELARQATLLRDMDLERDRLRDRIHGMQATIDNIQKELAGGGGGPGCAERRQRPERLRAEPAPPLDRMLYNFLSDASADADGHDSPLSLSQVKIDLNAKSRAFFKNKRCDAKHKRAK